LVFSGPYVTGVGFLMMLQQSCWNTWKRKLHLRSSRRPTGWRHCPRPQR
jgi:hypothetical protein